MSKDPRRPSQPWWKEGVRFDCQGSGRCCLSRGTHGYVYLTLADRQRFARHQGLSTAEFTRRFCRKEDGWYYIKPASGEGGAPSPSEEHACRFLDGKRCSVYEARPAQCRTWPFWPENMRAKTWDREVAAFCPGVAAGQRGEGRLYTGEEISALLEQDPLREA
jgi:Fe-S-cluster containining protein